MKWLIMGPLLALCISAAVYGYAARLSHPELTETELLLRFWWVWLVVIGSAWGALAAEKAYRK